MGLNAGIATASTIELAKTPQMNPTYIQNPPNMPVMYPVNFKLDPI